MLLSRLSQLCCGPWRRVTGLLGSEDEGTAIFAHRHGVTSQLPVNLLTPNDSYRCRTALLTSKRCTVYIYSTNIGTEYFKHGIYCPFLSLQNAGCFIILTYLVPVLFTFYIQCALNVAFYIFIQQIQLLNILNMAYTLCFFLFKMQFVS